jgi:hypothetical protein
MLNWVDLLKKEKEIMDLLIVIEKSKKEVFAKEHRLNNMKLKIFDSKNRIEMTELRGRLPKAKTVRKIFFNRENRPALMKARCAKRFC